jgi:hypothetical protein
MPPCWPYHQICGRPAKRPAYAELYRVFNDRMAGEDEVDEGHLPEVLEEMHVHHYQLFD